MANAKFDPVAQYPDYQPGAGSMLMKSLLAIQAHKDEQARQAQRDAALIAEQQSLQHEREQKMQEDLLQHQLNLHAIQQKSMLDQATAEAAGKVAAEQAKGAAANQVANTQAAADMHGNAAQAATDMHGATTQALADMHGAGTQANADTNAANIAAATPTGEGAPTPKPAEVTPPPEPPALPQSESFLDKLTGRNLTLPFFNQAQQDAIEADALKKKVAETGALARAKEPTIDVIENSDGSTRLAREGEMGAITVPIHVGIAGLLKGNAPSANLKFENVVIDGKATMATPQEIDAAKKAGKRVSPWSASLNKPAVEPGDYSDRVSTAPITGVKYLSAQDVPTKLQPEASKWATDNHVTWLDANNGAALSELTNATTDLNAAYSSVKDLFSNNLAGVAKNKVLSTLQLGDSGARLNAYNKTIADFAVRVMRSTAGKAGLRIQRDLLDKIAASVINPNTDTARTAEEKLSRLKTYMTNVEKSVLRVPAAGETGDQKPASGPPTVTTKAQYDALASGTTYVDSSGNQYVKK